MHKITKELVASMRQDKINGASLLIISEKYGCAKSTASLYCRDLILHPYRKALTEREARDRDIALRKARGCTRKMKPCIKCQKMIRADNKTGFCLECWKVERAKNITIKTTEVVPAKVSFIDRKGHHKLIPCRKCGKPIRKNKSGLCKDCRYFVIGKLRDKNPIRFNVYPKVARPIVNPSPCPKSPTGAHRWMLDGTNNGTCFYCDALFKNGGK